ncbi:MAG TPA: poly-gamma-glutamate synthase PgsB [candidate division Zixibacteria bacterium]|nr:poly-gamma-glutamate synthase PgsB [candidate division Zixibacteria bacterium]
MLVAGLLLSLVVVALIVEKLILQQHRESLQFRIHVGGTRGKTSVTRYIAAGFRACGISTCAKVTGTKAARIDPSGRETAVRRPGGPRLQEQLGVIRWAAGSRAKALVVECMSITPELQRMESRIIKPHLLVLTRIRDDHREHLGTSENQVAGMCECIPRESKVLTDDRDNEQIIRSVARARRSKVILVPEQTPNPIESGMDSVPEINIALALGACEAVGLDKERALAGILAEARKYSDRVVSIGLESGQAWFIDGFAVNDIESAQSFVDRWRGKLADFRNLVVMLNTRSDRPLRSDSFVDWLVGLGSLRHVILMGDHSQWSRRALARRGFPSSKITLWTVKQASDARNIVRPLLNAGDLVIGLGNTHGAGLRVTESLAEIGGPDA